MQLTIQTPIPTPTITAEAQSARAEIITRSQQLTAISDGATLAEAQSLRKMAVKFRTGITADKREALRPLDEAYDAFSALVKEFSAAVLAEEERLTKLIEAHALAEAAEARRKLEIARAAEAEALRKKLEAEAAERAAKAKADAEAKAAMEAAEAAVKASEDPFEKAEAEAELEAAAAAKAANDKVAAEQEFVNNFNRDREHEAAQQRAAALAKQAAAPIKGFGFKQEIEIFDIVALYAAHPELVTLTPKLNDIKAAVKAGVTVAGIKIVEVPNVR